MEGIGRCFPKRRGERIPVDDDWGIMIFKFDKKSIEKMQKDKAAVNQFRKTKWE